MTDDEIEEKLRNLSPTQLLGVIEELLRGDTLTNGQRQELLELQPMLKEEAKQREVAAKNLLREKGPQILESIKQQLRGNSLTTETREKLERGAAMLAGYMMRDWLPPTLWRKVLMFLALAVGVIGGYQWSPWLGLFMLLGCSCSPRVVGEVANFIGKLSK
jgi:hypothetical protein